MNDDLLLYLLLALIISFGAWFNLIFYNMYKEVKKEGRQKMPKKLKKVNGLGVNKFIGYKCKEVAEGTYTLTKK